MVGTDVPQSRSRWQSSSFQMTSHTNPDTWLTFASAAPTARQQSSWMSWFPLLHPKCVIRERFHIDLESRVFVFPCLLFIPGWCHLIGNILGYAASQQSLCHSDSQSLAQSAGFCASKMFVASCESKSAAKHHGVSAPRSLNEGGRRLLSFLRNCSHFTVSGRSSARLGSGRSRTSLHRAPL